MQTTPRVPSREEDLRDARVVVDGIALGYFLFSAAPAWDPAFDWLRTEHWRDAEVSWRAEAPLAMPAAGDENDHPLDWRLGGEYRNLYVRCRRWAALMEAAGVDCVYVFDGSSTRAKRGTALHRLFDSIQAARAVAEDLASTSIEALRLVLDGFLRRPTRVGPGEEDAEEDEGDEERAGDEVGDEGPRRGGRKDREWESDSVMVRPFFLSQVTQMALVDAVGEGRVLKAPWEADAMIAFLARRHGCATVFSNDSDFLLLQAPGLTPFFRLTISEEGTPRERRGTSSASAKARAAATTTTTAAKERLTTASVTSSAASAPRSAWDVGSPTARRWKVTARIYSSESLSRALRLPSEVLPLLGCLVGNDFVEQDDWLPEALGQAVTHVRRMGGSRALAAGSGGGSMSGPGGRGSGSGARRRRRRDAERSTPRPMAPGSRPDAADKDAEGMPTTGTGRRGDEEEADVGEAPALHDGTELEDVLTPGTESSWSRNPKQLAFHSLIESAIELLQFAIIDPLRPGGGVPGSGSSAAGGGGGGGGGKGGGRSQGAKGATGMGRVTGVGGSESALSSGRVSVPGLPPSSSSVTLSSMASGPSAFVSSSARAPAERGVVLPVWEGALRRLCAVLFSGLRARKATPPPARASTAMPLVAGVAPSSSSSSSSSSIDPASLVVQVKGNRRVDDDRLDPFSSFARCLRAPVQRIEEALELSVGADALPEPLRVRVRHFVASVLSACLALTWVPRSVEGFEWHPADALCARSEVSPTTVGMASSGGDGAPEPLPLATSLSVSGPSTSLDRDAASPTPSVPLDVPLMRVVGRTTPLAAAVADVSPSSQLWEAFPRARWQRAARGLFEAARFRCPVVWLEELVPGARVPQQRLVGVRLGAGEAELLRPSERPVLAEQWADVLGMVLDIPSIAHERWLGASRLVGSDWRRSAWAHFLGGLALALAHGRTPERAASGVFPGTTFAAASCALRHPAMRGVTEADATPLVGDTAPAAPLLRSSAHWTCLAALIVHAWALTQHRSATPPAASLTRARAAVRAVLAPLGAEDEGAPVRALDVAHVMSVTQVSVKAWQDALSLAGVRIPRGSRQGGAFPLLFDGVDVALAVARDAVLTSEPTAGLEEATLGPLCGVIEQLVAAVCRS